MLKSVCDAMNLEILKHVGHELNESLAGGFINKIYQPLPREIVLKARVKGTSEMKVMVSADPKFGRIHLTQLKIPNPPAPPRFCAFLRAHLQGAVIDSVSVADDDRVLTMKCLKKTGQALTTRLFILELLGRDSNMLLVDGESHMIMDCLLTIPEKETATRAVRPGMPYVPPPKRAQHREPANSAPQSLTVRPAIVQTPEGKRELRPSPISPHDETFETMNEAADAFYGPLISGMIVDSLRRTYTAPLRTRLASLSRRMQKIAQDKERLERLAAGMETGELLKANLHKVTKGMEKLEVMDWSGQRPVTIPLDPSLDAVANMQRLFAKASKGKRGRAYVEQRMADTIAERRALEDLLFLLQEAETLDELSAVVEGASIPHEERSAAGKHEQFLPRRKGEAPAPYRRYLSESGFTILVGKTGAGNDSLIRKKAREGDLWFHAKDAPGAHVVMLAVPGKVPTEKDIRKAAAIAGYFSRLRSAGKGEIMMAKLRNVRKIPGSTPGKVAVATYETLAAQWSVQGDFQNGALLDESS
ncbi:MAG: Rqc2 family fibronectin-binding protein [Desulfomonilaceae bacterium]